MNVIDQLSEMLNDNRRLDYIGKVVNKEMEDVLNDDSLTPLSKSVVMTSFHEIQETVIKMIKGRGYAPENVIRAVRMVWTNLEAQIQMHEKEMEEREEIAAWGK